MSRKLLLKIFSFFILFLVLWLDVTLSWASRQGKYYRLYPRWLRYQVSIQPFDMNQDGIDELFIQHHDQQIDLINWELNYWYRSFKISGQHNYVVQPIPTAVNDSITFLVAYQTEDSVVFKILPPTPLTIGKAIDEKFLKDFIVFYRHKDTSKNVFYQSMGAIAHITNSIGENLTLFTFNTSWDTNGVRGLLAADVHTRKVVWQYLIGPCMGNINITDLDRDGKIELVVGTYASHNGVKGNNTADDSSYVFVLDCDGHLKWKRAIGPYWTGAWAGVGDFYRDGRKSIVVYQYSNRKSFPNQDKIQILDAHDGLPLEEKGHGNQFTAATVQPQLQICRDFNGDGKDEIVVGNTDGFVRLLDGKLTELRPSKPYQKRVTIEAVEDLDGDGFWEVVCVLPNDQIVVLDNQLQELCHWLITAPASETYLQVVHAGNKNHLLVISTFPDHNEYQLLECQTSPVPFPAISSAKKAAPWIGLTLLLITVAIVIRNLFFGEKARTMLPSLLEEANLMDRALLMNRQGKITRVGRYWSTILQLPPHTLVGKNWQQIFSAEPLLPLKQAVTDIFQKRFPETSVTFSPGEAERQIPIKLKSLYLPFIQMYCLMIFDLTEEEHIRQVKHWAQVAQKLAHSIKNPLTTVKLSAEELRHRLKEYYQIQEKELDEFFDDMIGQVTRLKRMSDEFMRFVEFEQPILMPVDLNTEVKELVLHWQPERSSRIHIDWELGENLPPALIDREQFAHALRNVFFNAVESLKDGGRILISTQKAQLFPEDGESHTGATYIGLQIRDTGCGIPPEYLDKVTQPWFTYNKPEGSGLGLSIVQKVMDSHGGKFDIQSEMGKGTTVTLWFRVKR